MTFPLFSHLRFPLLENVYARDVNTLCSYSTISLCYVLFCNLFSFDLGDNDDH